MKPGVIFAATDFSEPADEALRQAHQRASQAGAHLVVCHIVPAPVRVNILLPQRNVEALGSTSELEGQALQAPFATIGTYSGYQMASRTVASMQSSAIGRPRWASRA